jgi:hypothetical protein
LSERYHQVFSWHGQVWDRVHQVCGVHRRVYNLGKFWSSPKLLNVFVCPG